MPLTKEISKVSICIPTYNASKFIAKTIRSILDSSYSNIEIIVSDDASKDDTCSIINDFNDPRIKIYQNPHNVGPVRNWNCAVKKASGEFIGLLAHDDLIDAFWISFAVRALENNPSVGWVATAFKMIDEEDRILKLKSAFPETRKYDPIETFPLVAKLDGDLGPFYIARRCVLEEIGFYDEESGFSADNDLFLRLAWRFPMFYSSFPHTAYRINPGSLTDHWSLKEQTLEALRMLDRVFGDPNLPVEIQAFREYIYNNICVKILGNGLLRLKGDGIQDGIEMIEVLIENVRKRRNDFRAHNIPYAK